jgi:acylphosphatase
MHFLKWTTAQLRHMRVMFVWLRVASCSSLHSCSALSRVPSITRAHTTMAAGAGSSSRDLWQGFAFEVQGKVQGVFFRVHTKQKADELRVLGWVENHADGKRVVRKHNMCDAPTTLLKWLYTRRLVRRKAQQRAWKRSVDGCQRKVHPSPSLKRRLLPRNDGSWQVKHISKTLQCARRKRWLKDEVTILFG